MSAYNIDPEMARLVGIVGTTIPMSGAVIAFNSTAKYKNKPSGDIGWSLRMGGNGLRLGYRF